MVKLQGKLTAGMLKQTLWLHVLANYHMLQYVTSDRLDRDEESASVSVCECHNQ